VQRIRWQPAVDNFASIAGLRKSKLLKEAVGILDLLTERRINQLLSLAPLISEKISASSD
jgi:hypothetical protein